jgi:hypothetical protein
MTTAFGFFRVLQVMSLSVMLFAPPAWAQQSYRDADDDTTTTSQDVDNESDDDGRSFEHELADIETQYSQLIPDHAKGSAYESAPNDVDSDNEAEEEEDE